MTARTERLRLPSGRVAVIETRRCKDFDTVSYRLLPLPPRKPARRKARKP